MKQLPPTALAMWALAALPGCATYRSAPIDPTSVLEGLEAISWASSTRATLAQPGADAAASELAAVGPRELASVAVSTNPQLAALRAEIGIQSALLVEAGLLPDPALGWDAMNNIASQAVSGTSSSIDTISGFSMMFPLLRPGERGARRAAAEWRTEEVRRRLTAAEWALTRDVHVAYEEVLVALLLFSQTTALTELAGSTHDYFKRAREAGAATAIQANLALGQLQAMRLDVVRAEARIQQARQTLNGLVGLPPSTEIALITAQDPSGHPALQTTAAQLTGHALDARPDLAVMLARYETSEEEVRLAIASQFPLVSVGTGLSLVLPVFSRFGRPAIATAIARRGQIAREFTAAVHGARQEISATHTLWNLAQKEVELLEAELLPNAERNLELSREAFSAGEVTLLETLALQRALVEARTRHTETRAELSKRAWKLLAASGWLLATPALNESDDGQEYR
ncbi:MAG: cobalt-zinc-cadmium efflux system outer membrane protein [Chlamydiales bacterium]|jgi:cobalt-zinc-cadmium efflux system outer membrane protein